MRRIVKTEAQEHYPLEHFSQLHRNVIGTPSAAVLARYGWAFLLSDFEPEVTATQVAERGPVEWRDGVAFWTWAVRDLSAEEIARRLADKRATMRLMRGEFAIRAAGMGLITPEEAEAWAGGTSLPASVTNAFAAHIADDMERLAARVDALTASHIHRVNPLILLLQAQLGLSDDSIDALFSGVLGPNT